MGLPPATHGTVYVPAGSEVPLEPEEGCASTKHCWESKALLRDSILWQLQDRYYEALGESAWNEDIPIFVSSNAKLAQDYARVIFNWLRDVYACDRLGGGGGSSSSSAPAPGPSPKRPSPGPCLLLEIGAGHGRFTCLLLRSLLRFQPFFEQLGMPPRPFVLIFTDVASQNVEACRQHPDLRPFVEDGWLDFAVLDANDPPSTEELRQLASRHGCVESLGGEVPTALICNYVLDTLAQEALQFSSNPRMVRRGRLSIFSQQDPLEEFVMDSSFTSGLSFAWDWEECPEFLEAADAEVTAAEGVEDGLLAVIRAYLAKGNPYMTALVPIGGFKLLEAVGRLSGNRLLFLVGDKGHQDPAEFKGWRAPHLAVHGSFSFMVNFDALRIFFEHLGGFSQHTPYQDSFQCGVYSLGRSSDSPSLLSSLADLRCDFGPATMMLWSHSLALTCDSVLHPHLAPSQDFAPQLVKNVMAHLRYSGHDPDLFWQFQPLLLKDASLSSLGRRGVKDLAFDLDQVYRNSYRMRSGASRGDLPAAIGECLMRVGQIAKAIEYFHRSIADHGPSVGVLLQMSCCLQAEGRIEEAMQAVEEALCVDPQSSAAKGQRRNLEMYANSLGCALIGGGIYNAEQSGPLLAQDLRFRVKAVFAFREEEARATAQALEKATNVLKLISQGQDVSRDAVVVPGSLGADAVPERIEVLWGSEGLEEILQRSDIPVCVVDVHHKLLTGILPKLWASRKHVLSHSPLAFSLDAAMDLISAYQALPTDLPPPAWHVMESARFEDALTNASESLEKVGRPRSISMTVITARRKNSRLIKLRVPKEEQMAIDLVHGLVAVLRVTGEKLRFVSCQEGKPPADSEKSSSTDGGDETQALAGHFVVSPAANSPDVSLGTFMVCCSGSEAKLEVRFHCQRGSLVLKREKSAWQMTVTDDSAGVFGRRALERSVPCVGFRGSHRSFLGQIRAAPSTPAGSLDASVEHALLDTAILSCVLGSLRANGASMSLKYSDST